MKKIAANRNYRLAKIAGDPPEEEGELVDLGLEKIKRDPTHPMNIKSRRFGIVRSELYGGVQQLLPNHMLYASVRELLIGVLDKGLDPKGAPYNIIEM